MRAWLYNRIKAIIGFPAGMETRVISSGAADNPTKPFMILQMDVEDDVPDMPAEMRVQNIPFTVWVHDTPGSMLNIDAACVLLKNNLPTRDGMKVGNLSLFEIRWRMIGEDAYDDHFGTMTRPVRFTMMTRR